MTERVEARVYIAVAGESELLYISIDDASKPLKLVELIKKDPVLPAVLSEQDGI